LNTVTRHEASVHLRAQLMDLLLCLARRPGVVVAKDELRDVVWEGRLVSESSLSRCIAELRAALGDDAQRPHVIETITKRGYRLIAPVEPAVGTVGLDGTPVSRSWWQRLQSIAKRWVGGPAGD
jgi:DNA-binding winged helix-turn-helix (wHTH) protein